MIFNNYFQGFNTNLWSGVNNINTPQWSFVNIQAFSAPSLNFNLNWSSIWNNTTTPKLNTSLDTFTKTPTKKPELKTPLSNSSQSLMSLGYNAQKGQKLAKRALSNATGFRGKCATYVKNAIRDTGLGAYVTGDAYKMTEILGKNSNFKQVSNSIDVKTLPAGCVLVYNKGSQHYSAKYGHTEITTGNNKAVSDGITNNIRKPDAIFIPV